MRDIQEYWRSLSDEDHRRASEALEKSIQHWRDNVAAETPNEASIKVIDCALCGMFAGKYDDEGWCAGCPVRSSTGISGCLISPYPKAANALFFWRDVPGARETFTAAAQAELDFLISLRPQDARQYEADETERVNDAMQEQAR